MVISTLSDYSWEGYIISNIKIRRYTSSATFGPFKLGTLPIYAFNLELYYELLFSTDLVHQGAACGSQCNFHDHRCAPVVHSAPEPLLRPQHGNGDLQNE